ncbi:MAG: hypothetical protein HQL99_12245 [Magnetococcales bacterium]|nr:hypothetical protein [Magnetococcales bacterium]
MNISRRTRIIVSVSAVLVVLLAGAVPAWVAEHEEKAKSAKMADFGLAKDPIALLEGLEKRRMALDEREKLQELREVDLKRLEEKMNKRIAALEVLRQNIREDLAQEKVMDDANIKRLAKIYAGMKPKAAAASLMAMDRETAVKALKAVPEKVAAKILSRMDVADAVQLSEAIGVPIAAKRGEDPEEAAAPSGQPFAAPLPNLAAQTPEPPPASLATPGGKPPAPQGAPVPQAF